MRRTLALLVTAALLGGCTQGYVIDRLRPRTFLVDPQLARFGLTPDQVQCVGSTMAERLSAWQMRLLADKAGAVTPGGDYPEKLGIRDLLWVASHVKDPVVSEELVRATGVCGVPTVEVRSIEAAAEPTPPASDEPPAMETVGPTNGPADYRPSKELLQALEAYEKGDFAAAARLGTSAAASGDSGANQFLGGLYSVGHGVAADPVAAVRYYRLAADQGWSEAMNNLGRAYETGEGVPRDPVEALKWYMLASARETEDPQIVQRNITSVVGTMSTDDITRAATLAKQWEQARRR